MALFRKKRPKLPSYVGAELDELLRDAEWAYAIEQAGIEPSACEVVLRLADATVGSGTLGGVPESGAPAILFGQGGTLAIAYPGEREIRVSKRQKDRAQLQTQRSGWFQILFGPPSSLDGFMFWGQDDLKLGTPAGEAFGQVMLGFLADELSPGQIFGTPRSLISGQTQSSAPPTGAAESAAPSFDDPEDALRWKLVHAVHGTLAEMIRKNTECFEKAETVEKAFGLANADYVNGTRHHELSKQAFREMGENSERELEALLRELRDVTLAAQTQWQDLLFMLPGSEHDVIRIANWCNSHGVDSGVLSSVMSNGMFVYTDFGLTREAFWTENERVAAVLKNSGQ